MIRTFIVAALGCTALAAPALAGEPRDPRVAAGCTKQQVHTPAGKIVQHQPIYFCKTKAQTVAANDRMRTPTPDASPARN